MLVPNTRVQDSPRQVANISPPSEIVQLYHDWKSEAIYSQTCFSDHLYSAITCIM